MKLFYVKERHNPQLGIYFVACGVLSKTEAKRHERTLYGYNVMHGFNSEDDYNDYLAELKIRGERVQ